MESAYERLRGGRYFGMGISIAADLVNKKYDQAGVDGIILLSSIFAPPVGFTLGLYDFTLSDEKERGL